MTRRPNAEIKNKKNWQTFLVGNFWAILVLGSLSNCAENFKSNYFAPGFEPGDRPVEQTINNAPNFTPRFIAPTPVTNFAPQNPQRFVPNSVPYSHPNSRYYSNPYDFPMPNKSQNFDSDQYYTAPKNILNREY